LISAIHKHYSILSGWHPLDICCKHRRGPDVPPGGSAEVLPKGGMGGAGSNGTTYQFSLMHGEGSGKLKVRKQLATLILNRPNFNIAKTSISENSFFITNY